MIPQEEKGLIMSQEERLLNFFVHCLVILVQALYSSSSSSLCPEKTALKDQLLYKTLAKRKIRKKGRKEETMDLDLDLFLQVSKHGGSY